MENEELLGPITNCLSELEALESRHRELTFEEIRSTLLRNPGEGWSLFIEKYSRFVYSIALKLVGPEPDQEELVHQVYAGTFETIRSRDFKVIREFKGRCNFRTYLYRIVQTSRSRVFTALGRQKRTMDYVDFTDEVWGSVLSRKETPLRLKADLVRNTLEEILEELDPAERTLLNLRFQKGLKLRELALALGFKDTNGAAYALKKVLDKFDVLRRLKDRHRWNDDQYSQVAEILGEVIFE
jgi:RNA polymerase sigma-70 factor (ECF subfamily)